MKLHTAELTGCNCKAVYTDVVGSREASVHVDADEPHCVLTEGGIAPPQKEAEHHHHRRRQSSKQHTDVTIATRILQRLQRLVE